MRYRNLFTVLYLAIAVLLTVLALQVKVAANLISEVWMFAGLSYLVAWMSRFSFWRRGMYDREKRISAWPAWQQTMLTLVAVFILASILLAPLWNVSTTGWSIATLVQLCAPLPLVILSAEQWFVRSQVNRG